MRKSIFVLMVLGIISVLAIGGCGQNRPAESAQAAIDASKILKDNQAQAKYLLAQANFFLGSQRYEDAVKTAKYVFVIAEGEFAVKAQAIIDHAQEEMKKFAESKVEEVKEAVTGKAEEVQGAVGNLGK